MPQSLVSLLLDPDERLIDRDLSWLQFNERVLHEAQDENNPLIERLKFLGITSSNLDEFFMIRFASVSRELTAAARNPKKNKSRAQRLAAIRAELLRAVKQFSGRQAKVLETICESLISHRLVLSRNLGEGNQFAATAKELFYKQVLETLGPPRYFDATRLRDIRNLQVGVLFPGNTFLPVPKQLPAILWKEVRAKQIVGFFLDDILATFLGPALGESSPPLIFRVTRDADVRVELEYEDPESIPDIVRQRIGTRERRRPLRLQLANTKSKVDPSELLDELKLPSEQVFSVSHPLYLHGCIRFAGEVHSLFPQKKQLFFPKFEPCVPQPFDAPGTIFAGLETRDYFFHHPYDSFQGYVNFITEAVNDRHVTSIQQTVYRVDALSEVTELLKKAAKKGRFVRVIIEPRARFDEINNIQLAEELRSAGVDVVFATGSLKMHAKVALVTRRSNCFHVSSGSCS